MKCPICNGKGTQFIADYDGMYDIVCYKCKGKGELDENGKPILTNEEWLKSLSTEELANYIATQCADAIRLWREMQYWTANEKCRSNKWYVWLKEVHNADRS